VTEERLLIVSRKYQKGSDTHQLFVAEVKGLEISGTVFQYELWLNSVEQRHKRVTSGNAFEIRRTFITKLLDLQDEGWSNQGSATYGHPEQSFFDPARL
jgi:hypothetical protein